MADDSIVINTEIDDKKAQAELTRLNRKIDSLNDKIKEQEAMKMPLVEQSKQLSVELDKAKAKLAEMQSGDGFYTNSAIKEQQSIVNGLQREYDGVNNKIDSMDNGISRANIRIEQAKEKAGGYQQQLAAAAKNAEEINPALEEVNKRMDKFTKRIGGLIKRVFVFSLITTALRGMRTWLGNVIKTNGEATKAIAQLKGALLTLAQPLVQIIIPAFITFVKVLTQVVSALVSVVSGIFGTTAADSAKAAEALNDQTKALNGTGSAAKKASKSLASFDEINKLSSNSDSGGGSASSIAPDFSFLNETSDRLKDIAEIVISIGTGLAAWKIASGLAEALGLTQKQAAGLGLAIAGVTLFLFGLADAWENGVDWKNLTKMIAGAALAATGLYLAFGNVGAGIALVVSGAGMIVTAFQDIVKNGANLQNTLLLIAGIVATGLGFGLLTTSTIPLVIAGIAAIVVAILQLTGNLDEFVTNFKENIIGGIMDIIHGFINGDMEQVKQGLIKVAKGIANSVIIVVESLINFILSGVNWLIDKINSIHFEIPEWVPGIGGKSFSPNISRVAPVSIPRLAQGAVIPPNREFMAVLGDQKSGTNIETPLATMVQAFKQALAESGYSGGSNEAVLVLDRETLGKVIYKLNKAESNRVGVSLTGV